jgi:phenol 2-monooxygenase
VFQLGHREVDLVSLHEVLNPRRGALGLRDYEMAFATDTEAGVDVFDARGIDRAAGALVVVRPDQYVGAVLPLDAHDELDAYLGGILLPVGAPA